ncbi:hypothetical protein ANN_22898 [Periplaneta americana]|uniref:DUF4817 domain-containing protein n=1 Tax=Periplaneta americana TaxID=6978 RepID=A0ABQ8SJK3_PERAM|nr:hypothetical protein ANN_22898 [Periplaneta americana]
MIKMATANQQRAQCVLWYAKFESVKRVQREFRRSLSTFDVIEGFIVAELADIHLTYVTARESVNVAREFYWLRFPNGGIPERLMFIAVYHRLRDTGSLRPRIVESKMFPFIGYKERYNMNYEVIWYCGETRPRIRLRLPDIRLSGGENIGIKQTRSVIPVCSSSTKPLHIEGNILATMWQGKPNDSMSQCRKLWTVLDGGIDCLVLDAPCSA